jgi:hypothetical protein
MGLGANIRAARYPLGVTSSTGTLYAWWAM